jgi:hypothetical protein
MGVCRVGSCLSCKGGCDLQCQNTLAYNNTELITTIISFKHAPETNFINKLTVVIL